MTQEVFERMVDEYKLAQHRQDEKEFEEWWEKEYRSKGVAFIPYGHYAKLGFLASRRLQERPLCPNCLQSLEPDGSCLTCRMAERVKKLEDGIKKWWRDKNGTSLAPLERIRIDEELHKLVEKK